MAAVIAARAISDNAIFTYLLSARLYNPIYSSAKTQTLRARPLMACCNTEVYAWAGDPRDVPADKSEVVGRSAYIGPYQDFF